MSDLAQANVRQQLAMLKEQTRISGGLHEAQVLQLKMWPMVAFDAITGSEFTWDPDKKVVSFKIDLIKGRKPKLAWWKPRVAALNDWVQVLLGDEWCIAVKTSGKVPQTFNGTRKIADVRINRPDTGATRSPAD